MNNTRVPQLCRSFVLASLFGEISRTGNHHQGMGEPMSEREGLQRLHRCPYPSNALQEICCYSIIMAGNGIRNVTLLLALCFVSVVLIKWFFSPFKATKDSWPLCSCICTFSFVWALAGFMQHSASGLIYKFIHKLKLAQKYWAKMTAAGCRPLRTLDSQFIVQS